MNVCFEYVGLVRWWTDIGNEGQAAWVSAIGGLMTVGLTAWFYFKDRRERLRTQAKAAAEHQRERAYRAWKLALRIFPIVEASVIQFERIASAFDKDPVLGRLPTAARVDWEPHDPAKLEELMRDMENFSKDTQARLIFYSNLLGVLKDGFSRLAVGDGAFLYVDGFRQTLPSIREAIAHGKAASQALEVEVKRNEHVADERI